MRFSEQSDFLKALLAIGGVSAAEDIAIADGCLVVDGIPHRLQLLAEPPPAPQVPEAEAGEPEPGSAINPKPEPDPQEPAPTP